MNDDNRKYNIGIFESTMARLIQPFVPLEMELFPCPDGSVQFEDAQHTLEVYSDKFIYDDEEVSFGAAVDKLASMDCNGRDFKLELTFPKEFRAHFQRDRFKDSLDRIVFDLRRMVDGQNAQAPCGQAALSGRLEVELIEKIRDAVASCKIVV